MSRARKPAPPVMSHEDRQRLIREPFMAQHLPGHSWGGVQIRQMWRVVEVTDSSDVTGKAEDINDQYDIVYSQKGGG